MVASAIGTPVGQTIGRSITGGGASAGLRLTEAEFEALTEYENRTYLVTGVGTYSGPTLQTAEAWSYDPADLHVAKTGDDTTGDGSYASPYLTIAKAFSVMTTDGGQTVWVREGTYAEDAGSGYSAMTKAFTVQSYIKAVPGHVVKWINVSGPHVLRFNGANRNLTIKGFTLEAAGAVTNFINNSGTANVTGLEIVECTFNDTQTTSTAISIAGTLVSVGVAIKRCTFTSSGTFSCLFSRCTGIKAIGNTFTSTSTGAVLPFRANLECSGDLYFNSNTISTPNSASGGKAISQDTGITATCTIRAYRNTINTSATGIYIAGGTSGNSIGLYFGSNDIDAVEGVLVLGYVNTGACSSNTVSASGNVGIGFPTDGATGAVTGITMADNHVIASGANTHGILIGINASSFTLTGNTSDARTGGRYALVLKGTGHTVNASNTFYGGTGQAVYLKGANACTVTGNAVHQTVAGGLAIDFAADGTGPVTTDCVVTGNTVTVTNGKVYDFVAADLSTGNTIDSNTYSVSGPGAWGSMFLTTVSSLAEVRAAWAANYDQTTNDANSTAA